MTIIKKYMRNIGNEKREKVERQNQRPMTYAKSWEYDDWRNMTKSTDELGNSSMMEY